MISAGEVRTGMMTEEFRKAFQEVFHKLEDEIVRASKEYKTSCSYVLGEDSALNMLVAEHLCEALIKRGYHAVWRASAWVPGVEMRVRAAGEPRKVYVWVDWRKTINEIKKEHVGYVGRETT